MNSKKASALAVLFIVYSLGTLVLAIYLSQARYTPSNLAQLSGQTKLGDMRKIADIPTRKQVFLDTLAPVVERKNNLLTTLRQQLLQMQDKLQQGETLTKRELSLLARLAKRYQLPQDESSDNQQQLERLIKRVDTIPASLVLAQAATESGWGTSRFSREANNLFGQWCYTKGCGLVPKRRANNARHEVRKFSGIEEAIDAYFQNLNSHRAYTDLRSKRLQLRNNNRPVDGITLAATLDSYSSRGEIYTHELIALIQYNKLQRFDQTALTQPEQ